VEYGVIFDLDDTLLATSTVYYGLIIRAMGMVEDAVQPWFIVPERILEVYRLVCGGEITEGASSLFDQLGMYDGSPDVFPKRLAETFIECCLEGGHIPSEEEVKRVYALGLRIFKADYKLVPGAVKLINTLDRKPNVRMFIITHGSPTLQEPKLTGKDVFSKFEKIVVCPIKISKGVEIKKLMEDYDDITEWIMVGDSIPSDINPALAAGILAYNVQKGMSHIAEGKVLDIGSSLDRYKSFRDLDSLEFFLRKTITPGRGESRGFQIQV
jgi:FMN phosphatase YigB (HAD superfamily)